MKQRLPVFLITALSFLSTASMVLAEADSVPTNEPTIHVNISPNAIVKITEFGPFFSGAVGFLLLIAFIAAFIYLILGGISWITSGGDKAAVETARNKIINALIGLIIVAATWALFGLIGNALGFNLLKGFDIPRFF